MTDVENTTYFSGSLGIVVGGDYEEKLTNFHIKHKYWILINETTIKKNLVDFLKLISTTFTNPPTHLWNVSKYYR